VSSSARRESFTVSDADRGRRLDQVLAARVAGLSRRQARVLLDIGGVFVDGRRVKVASRPVRVGEKIVAVVGGALARATKRPGRAARLADEKYLPAYTIVFEDDDVVVVEKPSGLLTAPTPESDRNNLAELLRRGSLGGPDSSREDVGQAEPALPHATLGGAAVPRELFVVHRIDLETSGLIVFAKTDLANRVLSERFRTHDLERAYSCVVAGAFPGAVTRIDEPVGGRSAVTHVEIRERIGSVATALRCRLETGRTHQIRIHVAGLGHPVLGDARYGGERARATPTAPRMALHATTLAFAHPRDGRLLTFESPWPGELEHWLVELRRYAAAQPR
jgi:23S rRNA pseudouridine1911/1915/1917 synthase